MIPNESLSSQQILDKIRWVYKRRPDIIIYGSLAAGVAISGQSGSETYHVLKDEGALRKIGAEAARGQTDVNILAQIFAGKLDLTTMPVKFRAKFCLSADTDCDFMITMSDANEIVRVGNLGALTTADEIDNWEG